MESESEVHILKKTSFLFRRFLILVFLPFLFVSCANIGFYQLLFGEDDVDERYSGFLNLSSSGLSPVLSPGSDGKYSFIVVTDIHIGADDVGTSKINDFLLELSVLFSSDSQILVPRFIINLGDTGDGGHASEYAKFNRYFGDGGIIQNLAKDKGVVEKTSDFKIYSVLGNHDLYNNGWTNWKKAVWPYTSTYYFSVSTMSDSKCVPFSFYFLDTGNGSMGKSQTDGFEKLLKADQNPKLIFAHYPFYSDGTPFMAIEDTAERNYFLALLEKNKAAGLFGGHVHTNFKKDIGSFDQINTAALFKNGYFRLVTVDEKNSKVISSKLVKF